MFTLLTRTGPCGKLSCRFLKATWMTVLWFRACEAGFKECCLCQAVANSQKPATAREREQLGRRTREITPCTWKPGSPPPLSWGPAASSPEHRRYLWCAKRYGIVVHWLFLKVRKVSTKLLLIWVTELICYTHIIRQFRWYACKKKKNHIKLHVKTIGLRLLWTAHATQ